ncbi:hypothetical protein EDD29_3601 [Actinocorallia herbida]|uniref:Uncharacterized protein n=2 Tax=Actinocorallia herbida TaxID=58109 RepID=A0A3N1CXL2_9ACTN|nr:hypothetical protein EDD29_3601 [Actinocorallia herbida]
MWRMVGAVLVVVLGAGGCGSVTMDEETVARLTEQGVDPDLIFLVEVPGFDAAEQSMGPVGDDGFGMSYTSESRPGAIAHLRAEKTAFDDARCTAIPISDADPAVPVECASEATGWYRTSGGFHEYVLPLDPGGHLRLSAPVDALSAADLRASLLAAESLAGVTILTTPRPVPSITRGDLPSVGDGAPDNSVGEGG